MKEFLTPRQVARAIGVSEASMKRWCDRGRLPALRTAGGHRRLPISGVMQFIRESGYSIVDPEVLGLPVAMGQTDQSMNRVCRQIKKAFQQGNEEQCRQLIFNLYSSGHLAYDICDRVLAETFHELGEAWYQGKIEVYQERLAVEICRRLLFELRSVLTEPPDSAPTAVGGTLEADPYILPTSMVEVALREAGWRAISLGSAIPVDTFCAALENERPQLFWLSVSSFSDEDEFIEQYKKLYKKAVKLDIIVVVGGRALTQSLREKIDYTSYGDNLRHLINFVASLQNSDPVNNLGGKSKSKKKG
jgi:MerR family transcriptional regulator, light-induced transcriptional regulator